jgi:hypothetical protein
MSTVVPASDRRVPALRSEVCDKCDNQVILDVAAAEQADAIAMGWRQDPTPPYAVVVGEVLARTPIPVILLPITVDRPPEQDGTGGSGTLKRGRPWWPPGARWRWRLRGSRW